MELQHYLATRMVDWRADERERHIAMHSSFIGSERASIDLDPSPEGIAT